MNWKNALYVLALAALAYALLKIFDAEQALPHLDLPIAGWAVFAYLLSIAAWNIAWGVCLGAGWKESNAVGWSAQLGALTPFSVGNDLLRGYFGKRYGRKYSESIAASMATKFYKIGIAFLFSVLGAGILFSEHAELGNVLLWGVALPLLILVGVYFFTRERFSLWLARFSFKKISARHARDFSRHLKRFIHAPQAEMLFWLAASLAFEFLSFYAGFQAFGVELSLFNAYLVFSLMFFISKLPILPQGIVLTELVGLVLLQNEAARPLIAAGILLWNVSRIWAPTVVSFAFFAATHQKMPED